MTPTPPLALPALPAPALINRYGDGSETDYFTADQMNAHATAAILSDRAGRGDAAGWVSVEDRLPNVGKYIVASSWGVREASRCSLGGGTWWRDIATRTDEGRYDEYQSGKFRVTHWQARPAAPTGEGS